MRSKISVLLPLLLAFFVAPAFPQTSTGGITGRAQDASGALIPGVEVSLTSPSMIGGARTAATDEQGAYRFTLLSPGVYRVSFALPGFRTLNIDGVTVPVGTTMTINGTLEVASVAEELTVTSETPTIDLEAATISLNFSDELANLPTSRGIRSFVNLIPGLYSNGYDVGGSRFGITAGVDARTYGRSGGSSTIYDGVMWCQHYGDWGSYEEVQVSAAAKGAEATNPGVTMNVVVKSGSNDFHGVFAADYQNSRTTSNNVTQELLNRGYAPGTNKFTRYTDLYGDLGGPIMKDKLWFYFSYRDGYSGKSIPGFIDLKTGKQVDDIVQLQDPTLKVTYQMTPKMKLESMQQYGFKWLPYSGASRYVPVEATSEQRSWSIIANAKWTYIVTPKMTVEASLNRGGWWWPNVPRSPDVRRQDQTTNAALGAGSSIGRRYIRWQWSGAWTWFTNIAGTNNEIKSGYTGWWNKPFVESRGYPNQQVYRYRSLAGDTNYFLRPDSVQVYDYPTFVADIGEYKSWFLNDKITLNRQLTLNVGLRWDRYSSYLPEQGNKGTGPWSTKMLFPETRGFPIYNSWVPRLSLNYDVTGKGRLAFRASYGRYAGGTSGSTPDPGPGASTVNPAENTTWTYSNWDGTIPYTPNPANLTSVTGAAAGLADRRLDPNLRGYYLDEYTAGIDVGLSRDYTVRFNAVRKFDKRGYKTLNLAQPFSAYTDVVYAVDPGRDNATGTSDDGIMQAWSVPRSHPGFGKVINFTTNTVGGEANDQYTSFETTFSKRYADGWSMLAGFSTDHSNEGNNIPQNPNSFVYNWQIPERFYSVKLNGTYDLPFGMKYSSTYSAQSGESYGRTAQMRNALNSLVNVQVEGRVGRYPWVKIWDNRVSKTFKLNDRMSVEAIGDLFNSLNTNVVLTQTNTNGPIYLNPNTIIPPRVFRFGGKFKF